MSNEAYNGRARLVAFLAASYAGSHAGFTDPAEPDWLVVVVETPEGQMSWHISPDDQGLFNHVRRTKPTDRPWDGHTTEEKNERLARLTRNVSRETFATEVTPDGA